MKVLNILYITMLIGKKSAGVSYSIPAQIKSQSKLDNVFWYNINQTSKELIETENIVRNLDDYPSMKIADLPAPFNKPDIVVFEGLYFFPYIKIAKQCRNAKIPYIVIPRSSLTKQAQNNKQLKKTFGNLMFFNKFVRGATAIQYLTKKEQEDSTSKWNAKNFIIPNGISPKKTLKIFNEKPALKGVFIGRPDIYQKGLDMLLDACTTIKKELLESNCEIELYAPYISGEKNTVEKMIVERNLDKIVTVKDGVYGIAKEKVLLNSDFFILTSRFEGHPMGLIEALSYGVPCIVTEGSNMANEIKKHNAGWVAKNNSESIAVAFKELLNEINELSIKGENAYHLSRNYNWEKIAEDSHKVYQHLI